MAPWLLAHAPVLIFATFFPRNAQTGFEKLDDYDRISSQMDYYLKNKHGFQCGGIALSLVTNKESKEKKRVRTSGKVVHDNQWSWVTST